MVTKEYNFFNLIAAIKAPVARKVDAVNKLLQQLYSFKNILTNFSKPVLAKIGYTPERIKIYSPILEDKIVQAAVLKSELLNAEQLPGQVAMFGLKGFDVEGYYFDFIPRAKKNIITNPNDLKKSLREVRRYLLDNKTQLSQYNGSTGWNIEVNSESVKKWFSKKIGFIKLNAFTAIKDIIKVAVLVTTENPRHKAGKRKKIHKFWSVVNVDGHIYPFGFLVIENAGKFIYDTTLIPVPKTAKPTGLAGFEFVKNLPPIPELRPYAIHNGIKIQKCCHKSNLGRPFDEAREKSIHKVDNVVYNRQAKITDKLTGKSCQIAFTLNKTISGIYAIISADVLQPSHLGNIQNPLHFIPEAQPRNRATSQSGHNTPKLIADNLRPAELVEGATAYTGAPIVNERGEVIQGNGRGFTIKYYYSNYPNDPKDYKLWLQENKACYGITGNIDKINKPVLVRMVDASDETAIELGQFTQKDLEAVANETTQIKGKVGLISDASLDTIINNLLGKDTGEQTLSELIRESNILKVLVNENIIRGDDLEVYTRNGTINETGVNFITKLLLNLIFKDADVNTPDVFLQLPVPLQKSIEKSALYLLKCRGDRSINIEVSKAIIGLRDYLIFKPNGSLKEWRNQRDIFDGSVNEKYSEFEFKLIEIFSSGGTQKQIVDQFKNYSVLVNIKPGDMFEEERPALTKKEGIKQIFGIEIPDPINPKQRAIAAAIKLAQNLIQ